MPLPRALVHPSMLVSLPDHYPATATIQAGTETRDSGGEPSFGWATLAGHEDIPAAVGPASGGEVEAGTQTYTLDRQRLVLRGFYPSVTTNHRVMVTQGGLTTGYDVRAVAWDSHQTQTYLDVQLVASL